MQNTTKIMPSRIIVESLGAFIGVLISLVFCPLVVMAELSGVQSLSLGGSHSCALTTAGGVKCWGRNNYGQLGNGSILDRHAAVDSMWLSSGVQRISMGSEHSCAVMTAGGVKCWGRNNYGQLGDGSTTTRSASVDTLGLSVGVQAISLGGYHSCALTTEGGVKCWGQNNTGQLGDGSTTTRTTYVDTFGLSIGIQAISSGGYHSCALTTEGGVKCWGDNTYGQLGDGTTSARYTAADVTGLIAGVQAIELGSYHTCAQTTAGGVKCWGLNQYGRLGDGTNTGRSTAVDVAGLSTGIQAISMGGVHSCALTTAGGVKC